MATLDQSETSHPIHRVTPDGAERADDLLAIEEPMEIRVGFGPDSQRSARSLSITMRTPGNDFELAVGFLFAEGIVRRKDQVRTVEFCGPPAPGRPTSNIVRVDLAPEVKLEMDRLQRHFFTTSSCGICGKASLDALDLQGIAPLDRERPRVSRSVIMQLPDRLRSAQPLFRRTGGLHAAALVEPDGSLLELREDVGRHNAVDKLIGRRFLDGRTPMPEQLMVISGRASFEILQKALVAGVPMIVAVGAPSSLAVDIARRFELTLIGFASAERFNIYTEPRRIMGE